MSKNAEKPSETKCYQVKPSENAEPELTEEDIFTTIQIHNGRGFYDKASKEFWVKFERHKEIVAKLQAENEQIRKIKDEYGKALLDILFEKIMWKAQLNGEKREIARLKQELADVKKWNDNITKFIGAKDASELDFIPRAKVQELMDRYEFDDEELVKQLKELLSPTAEGKEKEMIARVYTGKSEQWKIKPKERKRKRVGLEEEYDRLFGGEQ